MASSSLNAAGRVEDHIRHLPAKLLGQFQAHGFLALDPVGLLQGGGVEPAHRLLALADDLAAIVDIAVNLPDLGALQLDLAHVDVRRVLRAEDIGLHAAAPAIGCHRRAGITVGRHGHALDAQFLGHGDGHHQAARLERSGGQATLILDQQGC
jgi:hypothetical protein